MSNALSKQREENIISWIEKKADYNSGNYY